MAVAVAVRAFLPFPLPRTHRCFALATKDQRNRSDLGAFSGESPSPK